MLSAHKLHPQHPPDHDSVSSAVAKRWRGRERIHFEEKWERKKKKGTTILPLQLSRHAPANRLDWKGPLFIPQHKGWVETIIHKPNDPFLSVCVREKRVQGGQDRGMLPALSDHLTVQSTATVLTFPKPR